MIYRHRGVMPASRGAAAAKGFVYCDPDGRPARRLFIWRS
jgi:hypothetical protein